MSDVVVRVDNLGKRYRIGRRQRYRTLRDTIAETATAPLRWLRRRGAAEGADHLWALRDVSFGVRRGEVVGVIGRNGAGKSTLLKVLSQITEPTAGEVEIRGRVGSLLEVGAGFHPELTGRENVFLNGAVLGMRRAEIVRKFDEIVAFAEIERFIDTPVKRFSSGMYMRLAFAVAAHLEPEILIVDEVLAVGDAEFQKKCLGKMGQVARGGRTVLFVSHNMSAVSALCTRVTVLTGGRLAFDGPVAKGLAAYAHADATEASRWVRPSEKGAGPLYFTEASAALRGSQPRLTLAVDLRLRAVERHAPAFIALDIRDEVGSPVMQALPSSSGFLEAGKDEYAIRILVELPPLIPGTYSVSPWVGPHNTITYDSVEAVVSFAVEQSPDPARTFPHGRDHGHVVPPSWVEYPVK